MFCFQSASYETTNKISLAFHKHFRLDCYLNHERDISPTKHQISAGISHGSYKYQAGLTLGESGIGGYHGQAHAAWGTDGANFPDHNKKIEAEIKLTKKNEADINYQFDANLKLPYLDQIKVGGKLLLGQGQSHVLLEWMLNDQVHKLDAKYANVNRRHVVKAVLSSNGHIYDMYAEVLTGETKSVQVDLKTVSRHYFFIGKVGQLDCLWCL